MASSLEIRCKACNRLTLARAEPVYEEFKKVAETFVCSACGHRYPSRDKTPFVDAEGRPRVFSEADKPASAQIFKSDERRRSCGWCRHFIVNPFSQRCGQNNRLVEATDVCARFLAKPDPASGSATGSTASAASSRFEALFGKAEPAAPVTPAPVKVEPPAAVALPAPPAQPAPLAPPPAPPPPPVQPEPLAPVKRASKKAPAQPEPLAPVKRASKKASVQSEPAAPAKSALKKAPAKKPVGRPRKPKAE